jgi:membrane protein
MIEYTDQWLPAPPAVLRGIELGLSFCLVTVLFAVLFKVLPDAVVEWRDIWVSAATTAALFMAGRYLIALYLSYAAPASPYGAAGSVVLVLLWVYYSSLILFFGAALIKARVLASGRRVVPRAMAVCVREELVVE